MKARVPDVRSEARICGKHQKDNNDNNDDDDDSYRQSTRSLSRPSLVQLFGSFIGPFCQLFRCLLVLLKPGDGDKGDESAVETQSQLGKVLASEENLSRSFHGE